MATVSGMLEGLRVVELGIWVAGPAVGGILADWGADVVKIESPAGDPMRQVLRLVAGHGREESPPFDLDNRGKRSVVVDLTVEEGRAVLDALLASADVFVSNLRPGALARLGLDPTPVRERHPRLVYASVSGYGLEGPEVGRAGYDVGAFWARSGVARLTVPGDEPPPMIRPGLGDHVTGLATVAGVLAALLERSRTGQGRTVEVSLLRTGTYVVGWDLGIQARFGKLAPTVGRTEAPNPVANCYRAGDDSWFWLLGIEADRHFPALCRAIGREDLGSDPRFADARGRRKQAATLIAELDRIFAGRPREHWAARFDAEGVWWAPVNDAADVLCDPGVLAAGSVVEVPAGGGAPAHRALATPVRFDGVDPRPGPVPALGEHTEQVLAEVGFGDAERARLRVSGAIGGAVPRG